MESLTNFFAEKFLNNPLNLGLLIVLGYVAYQTLQPKPKPIPAFHPKIIELRDFTPKELSAFDGRNGSEIYLAISGKVFDVSSKPDFYGPGCFSNLTTRINV